MVNTTAVTIEAFRARMAIPSDPVATAYARWWEEKRLVLREVCERVRGELEAPPDHSMAGYGREFAPVVDLVCRVAPGYGWIPAGPADPGTSPAHRLGRGTPMRFDHGEQEQCPGGPGENLLWFEIDPAGGTPVNGSVVVPYDLRFDFGANLAEVLLASAAEPLFGHPARLDALDADVRSIIGRSSSAIWTPPVIAGSPDR